MLFGSDAPKPSILQSPAQAELTSILSACEELLLIDDMDLLLQRAVEIARERIGLARVGLFVFDERRGLMLGTWGTDLDGNTVDEHHVAYEIGDNDREVFRRAALEGIRFTVFENCPIVVQLENETRVVGRGWVACTPLRSARARIGMLFNDGGPAGVPVDEAKQARTAILCSVLATLLDSRPARPDASPEPQGSGHPLVRRALRMLAKDPSLTASEIAPRLDISASRLARVFKEDMGVSLVEYRNHLRLERFQVLVDRGGENLLEAALAAGFGSYAQFHRVFRAVRGSTPRDTVRGRARRRRRPVGSS